jgi:iron complex transport system ATP-binding protein
MSLRLQDLSVDIGGRRIVTGIGFTVPDGSFAGLLGPNGSGKSTILKAIYRARRPSAGRVLLDGQDLLSMRPKEAARRIAVVAQEFTLEFDFTVAEMVMIGRTPHKRAFDRDDEADRAIAEQAMAQVGCQDLAHRGFNTLSGGEKQRVISTSATRSRSSNLSRRSASRSWPRSTTSAWPRCSATPCTWSPAASSSRAARPRP